MSDEQKREQGAGELRACPFCGGKAYTMRHSYAGQAGYAVHCRGCEAEVFFNNSMAAATTLWNTRRANATGDGRGIPRTVQPIVRTCRESGCDRPATQHRPGFGDDFWHCEEHDRRNANAIKNADYHAS